MQQTLQEQGTYRWRTVTADAFQLGYYLHAIPTWFGEESILRDIRAGLNIQVTWAHVTSLLGAIQMQEVSPPVIIRPWAAEDAARPQDPTPMFPFPFDPNQVIYVPRTDVLYQDIAYNRLVCKKFLDAAVNETMSATKFKNFVTKTMAEWRRVADNRINLINNREHMTRTNTSAGYRYPTALAVPSMWA